MINRTTLQAIEQVSRLTMAVILLTAGTSKFFSAGGFKAYYSGLFQGDLRIQIPAPMIDGYLTVIPFIEVMLGACLLVARFKPVSIYAWYGFMLSLLVGHYILQEWSSVNQMLDYMFLGMICHALPTGSPVSLLSDLKSAWSQTEKNE
ncbi:MauE/DoxX family redox-associated membrane protein [Kordiimonas lacus]|uniref:Methylamine utilization protein MauE n=1 Tax=Kordiimonas lacus TaxID=637679 RepID=A0A1G6TT06_9PROT|nr:MauE/DoxX family redox-associated membrane protein [Kordiimonas lacus]SDD32044.1 hypothetical protein SAMN04488071_0341 [Kordiimonas lacus]